MRHCAKPAGRAALKLVAKVGSILEEEDERGVAHIVEHLAFNASGVCDPLGAHNLKDTKSRVQAC